MRLALSTNDRLPIEFKSPAVGAVVCLMNPFSFRKTRHQGKYGIVVRGVCRPTQWMTGNWNETGRIPARLRKIATSIAEVQ